jgi:dipeptidyl aminopeptidase/acylaminoacyl peptidase
MTTSLRRLLEQEAQRTKRSSAPLDDVLSGGASVVRRRRVVGIAVAAAVAMLAIVAPLAILGLGSDTEQPVERPQCELPWLIGSGYSRAPSEPELANPDFTEIVALPEAGSLSPTFSPDGTRIASVEYLDEMAGAMVTSAIVVTDADGRNARRITGDTRRVQGPAWSPDGTRIAYTSDRYTNHWTPARLHLVNADGTGRRTVELTAEVDDALAWADDHTILYVRRGIVWRVNLDAPEPIRPEQVRSIPEPAYGSELHFSPDASDVVVAVGGRQSHLEIFDLATGRFQSIPESDVVGWGSVQALGWTSDGRLLFGRNVKSSDTNVFEIFEIWAVSEGGWGESSQVRTVDADDLQPLPYAVNPSCPVPE